jgi:hypothetical protein
MRIVDKKIGITIIKVCSNAEVESSLVGLPDFKSGATG